MPFTKSLLMPCSRPRKATRSRCPASGPAAARGRSATLLRVGTHHWRSVCSVPADRGLHGLSGTVTIEAYRGDNPLYLHGPLRVAADRRHFEHLDGTPFFWLADTWWMGLCQRLHWPPEFQQLAADRKAKGFNAIQIVAGLYPDMPAFDPRGPTRRASLGKRLLPHPARVFRQGRPASRLPCRSGLCAVHRAWATIFPGWAHMHEGALALPGRPLRRACRWCGARWVKARCRFTGPRIQRGCRAPETRLDRGDSIHSSHRSVRPNDHHPSLAVRPGNGRRPGHPRFRHAPDGPPAGRRHWQNGPANAPPTRRSPPCR